MLTLVSGPPAVGKTTFVRALGKPFVDVDEYAGKRFGLPKTAAVNVFHKEIADEFDRFAEFVLDSGAEAIADCAVSRSHRARYVETFGPMNLVYLVGDLWSCIRRNETRPNRISESALVDKWFSQEPPQGGEGFMTTYLKKSGGAVLAMDRATMIDRGGTYEMKITDEEWERNDCVARINEEGSIVLGLTAEAKRNAAAARVRAVRDLKLRRCDHISPIRWELMSEDEKNVWRQYRQDLLDITKRPGFPWDGENVPWPDKPDQKQEG